VSKSATLSAKTLPQCRLLPSKALLHASTCFEEAWHSFAKMVVSVLCSEARSAVMINFKQQGDRRQRQGRRVPDEE